MCIIFKDQNLMKQYKIELNFLCLNYQGVIKKMPFFLVTCIKRLNSDSLRKLGLVGSILSISELVKNYVDKRQQLVRSLEGCGTVEKQ